jgi:UDP-N-acetylmuramate--alanine ligase
MDGSRAHLIGIGGNGMRALRDVLVGWGWAVSGSDLALGGHAAENVPPNADVAIYSDAVPSNNPELLRAAELSIPALSYFQALGKITAGGHTIAVAGTHGKSTTAAMIGHILTEAGRNPTVVCGAAPVGKTSGGRAGRKDLFVVEACEYLRNFLYLRPNHAAILNVEPDHFDCYHDLPDLETAFAQFAGRLPSDGFLLHGERFLAPGTAAAACCRRASFGAVDADWRAEVLEVCGGYYRFAVFKEEQRCATVELPLPGRHNVSNALAAAVMCLENGVTPAEVERGLETFPGLHRRFEIFPSHDVGPDLGSTGTTNVSVVFDYAHHPTEVFCAIWTAREVFPNRRIWCIFQPHQSSRTARLLLELAVRLASADKIIVAEIFRAREGPSRPGEVTAADLARQIEGLPTAEADRGKVIPVHQTDDIMDALKTQLRSDDVVVVLGAGDIHDTVGKRLLVTRE